MNQNGYIQSKIENGIARIEFGHPMSNSLPSHILTGLANEIIAVGNNNEAKVIILQSAGEKTFCAGASFDELIAISTKEEGLAFFSGFAKVINAIRTIDKLVIGRVQGKAVGGGVGLASACDYTFAVNTASIKLSELAVGIGPFVVGPAVERKMGVSAFSQLAIDASSWRDAAFAKQHGLYAQTFETIIEMNEAISVLANTLANSNPEAMLDLKKIFWEGTENWDTLLQERAMISGRLVLSDFTRNAINSFKGK
ncbi:MAG: enoyl-CoA hydratase/isomerase family protein [Chitinophagaceae bacterium]|nr:enoyl-CoA hydratase/isomerase family protein [Chitinophagaceae bacterium]